MAAKEVVGIGIIGSGFARSTQIPGFQGCEGARVTAIWSHTRANAERVAQLFGIPHVASDWRELVGSADVDLVSVVTPPSTHMEMTLAALDAGKAVLCEKPTAMNAREAWAMRERARETRLLAHIDHELRFLDGRRRMREMIRGGEIGRVRHVKVLFRNGLRASNERAWDWWSDERMGGGVLGAIGSHAIDAVRWLLCAEVSEVMCRLSTHVHGRPIQDGGMRRVTTDDETNMLIRFEDSEFTDGTTGNISLSMVEPGRSEHVVEVFGERGGLRVEAGELFYAALDAGEWRRVETDSGDLAEGMRDNEWSRGFTRFSREIVKALREGRNAVEGAATFDDGYHIQRVLDAARRSHESGCAERLKDEG